MPRECFSSIASACRTEQVAGECRRASHPTFHAIRADAIYGAGDRRLMKAGHFLKPSGGGRKRRL